jgi:hypothetical protein
VKEQLAQDGSIGPTSLDPSHVVTLTGELPNTSFGVSVATAGDVNGDGYDDVIVGAPTYGNDAGRAYIYLGSIDGPSITPSFTVTGEAVTNYLGGSVATAGDVNRDGYADIIVGASGYNNGTGRAYVYLGSASGISLTPAFTATGVTTSDAFGLSVATAGDVNGDGYADIIVGAPMYSNFIGRAYLYLASASGISATSAFTLTGEALMNDFGRSVATAGDVNGDGYDDVIVGAEGYSGSMGRAYVYLGSANGISITPTFTATGEGSMMHSAFRWRQQEM